MWLWTWRTPGAHAAFSAARLSWNEWTRPRRVTVRGDSVLDVSLLFAMIVYGLVALILHSLIDWFTARGEERAVAVPGETSRRRGWDGAGESRKPSGDISSGRR